MPGCFTPQRFSERKLSHRAGRGVRASGREPAELLRRGPVLLPTEPVLVPSGSVPRARSPDPAPRARTPSHPLLVAPRAEGCSSSFSRQSSRGLEGWSRVSGTGPRELGLSTPAPWSNAGRAVPRCQGGLGLLTCPSPLPGGRGWEGKASKRRCRPGMTGTSSERQRPAQPELPTVSWLSRVPPRFTW